MTPKNITYKSTVWFALYYMLAKKHKTSLFKTYRTYRRRKRWIERLEDVLKINQATPIHLRRLNIMLLVAFLQLLGLIILLINPAIELILITSALAIYLVALLIHRQYRPSRAHW